MTRGPAILIFAFVTACAHVNAPVAAPVVDDEGEAEMMRDCIVDSEACPALATHLETKLRDRYDAASAHRLAWQMTETFGRGDMSFVGTTITRCRAGHRASCRALWWAIDRLYLADDATVERANECGLSDAVASTFGSTGR